MPNFSAELEKYLLGLLILYPAQLKELTITPDIFHEDLNRRIFLVIEKYIYSGPPEGMLDIVLLSAEAIKSDPKVLPRHISDLLSGLPKSSPKAVKEVVEKLRILSQKRELWKYTHKLTEALEGGDDAAADSWLVKIRDTELRKEPEQKKTLAEEVKEWVSAVVGEFAIADIYRDLELRAKNDRKNVSVILGRMVKDGVLRRAGKLNGRFRLVSKDCEEVDWRNAPTESLPLVFPLDIHEWVNIFGGNIIVVAGSQNSGKTAMCLNFAIANQDKYDVYYFTSEMGATETKIRLELMDIPPDQVKVRFLERTDDFEDAVHPEAINIIDFLELNDEFYKVGSKITRIYERLTTGIAIIALQKDVNKEYGRGASMGLERPRLYLTINPGLMKIVKAKNWRGLDNPNGLMREFKLVNGWNFIPQGPWRKEPYQSGPAQHKKQSSQPKGRFQI